MPIDNKYLAKMRAMNSGGGSGGGVSVQPDWNQNDATQMDYIKNRPFYEETGEIKAPLDFSWDGDLSKQESYLYGTELGLSTYYARFSDLAPTKEEMLAGTIAINGSEAASISGGFEIKTIEEQFGAAGAVGYVVYGKVNGASAPWVLCVKEEATLGEAVFPKGLFLLALVYSGATTSYTANLSLPSVSTVGTVVHHIDPKYIKDMYYEEIQEGGFVEVLAEKEVTVSNGMYVEQGVFWDYALGDACIVTWEGVEYECVAMPATCSGMNVIALGNLAIFGGEGGNNEPFAIGIISGVGSGVIVPVDGTYTVGIKKSGNVSVIHKIDNKYIDAEWMATTHFEDITILENTVLDDTKELDIGVTGTTGDEVVFIRDGIEVTKPVVLDEILSGLVNQDVFSAGSYVDAANGKNTIPFVSWIGSATSTAIIPTVDKTEIWTIILRKKMYNTMPEGFLPNSNPAEVTIEVESGEITNAVVDEVIRNLHAGCRVILSYDGRNYNVIDAAIDFVDGYGKMILSYTNEQLAGGHGTNGLYMCYMTGSNLIAYEIRPLATPAAIHLSKMGPSGYAAVANYKLTIGEDGLVHVTNFADAADTYALVRGGEAELILNSSTEGSTKQFKITVDDSGTLTATEVTS